MTNIDELIEWLQIVKVRGAVGVCIDEGGLTLEACSGDVNAALVAYYEVGGAPADDDSPVGWEEG